MAIPHFVEHGLLALPIGILAACLAYTVDRGQSLPAYAAVAWVGGVFYYAGREFRDWEKGTVGKIGFDYSGLLAPMVSCALVFGIAVAVCRERPETTRVI